MISIPRAVRSPWGGRPIPAGREGFTLVELLISVLIISILSMGVRPVYHEVIQKTREAALKKNLYTIREALDSYYLDNRDSENRNIYPSALEDLVTGRNRYLRYIPEDPMTGEGNWYIIFGEWGGIYDIRSSSTDTGSNGRRYNEW